MTDDGALQVLVKTLLPLASFKILEIRSVFTALRNNPLLLLPSPAKFSFLL